MAKQQYQIELRESDGRVADADEIYFDPHAAIKDAKNINVGLWAQRTAGVLDKYIVVVPIDDTGHASGAALWRSKSAPSS